MFWRQNRRWRIEETRLHPAIVNYVLLVADLQSRLMAKSWEDVGKFGFWLVEEASGKQRLGMEGGLEGGDPVILAGAPLHTK